MKESGLAWLSTIDDWRLSIENESGDHLDAGKRDFGNRSGEEAGKPTDILASSPSEGV